MTVRHTALELATETARTVASATLVDASPRAARRAKLAAAEAAGSRAAAYAQIEVANTERGYESDWRAFSAWCASPAALVSCGEQPVACPASPRTVAEYIAALADGGYAAGTIKRHLSSISVQHEAAGAESPTRSALVSDVYSRIRQNLGTAPRRQAAPVSMDLVRVACGRLVADGSTRALRDRALLLIGFAAALRRAELADLDVADVAFCAEGARLTLRRSKTDQEGAGQERALCFGAAPETCPVRALREYLAAANVTEGPLFRDVTPRGAVKGGLCDRTVARIVQRLAADAGLPADLFSGHSLRAGFCTAASRAGVPQAEWMKTSGHRSERVAAGYVRAATLFDNAPSARLGL